MLLTYLFLSISDITVPVILATLAALLSVLGEKGVFLKLWGHDLGLKGTSGRWVRYFPGIASFSRGPLCYVDKGIRYLL